MDKIGKLCLMKKGAEASLFLAEWHGKKVVMKKRLPKKYRPPKLDENIRTSRTSKEPRLMHEAKKAGVPTPTIFLVDKKNSTIIMECIDGTQIKKLLHKVSESERRRLCVEIGRLIGRLHKTGIVHGDLTTSNMIQDADGKIFFIDFGLGEKTGELEAKGVDLHLMKRALQSTHFGFAEDCFEEVIEGYSEVVGVKDAKDASEKIREIERRGRYVTERKT
ncbi:Kae1-associated serine/threonine protein kinase [Candidatus Bathyarchaeota archaeon]|jgi:TP53 regulating kinase-like protein|nr:Kae1-associated serine/threonine protein kinase [Candidatus Bathyarchaeota archaeon]